MRRRTPNRAFLSSLGAMDRKASGTTRSARSKTFWKPSRREIASAPVRQRNSSAVLEGCQSHQPASVRCRPPLEVARHNRPALADAFEHVVEPLLEPRLAASCASALAASFGIAAEAQPPVGIERHGDDRSVVGPVLEQGPPPFQQVVELSRPVASAPGGENHVMGALYRGDAVDLDEAEALDQPGEVLPRRRPAESVPVEKQSPGGAVGKARQRIADTVTHLSGPSPFALSRRPLPAPVLLNCDDEPGDMQVASL